ncbi:hypothetical protein [Spiroplasma sp. ChiS]|uniref:hypothetical protein n=1 Tax=Spiroplasma sp. ChiS TaxID=2099885 RepID=UPI001F25ED2C|nr:hypothetical protein [Spiroplasma sp. ChiS]
MAKWLRQWRLFLKNRQQKIDFEFNNSEKDNPKDKSTIKVKSRTEWLKAIEQAPAGTIKVGLRNVTSNNHEQTMQRVDFKEIKNKSVTKAKFKKDLAIDETKELQLTIHDILDKSKKYMKNQSKLTDFSYIILVIADKNKRSEEKMTNLGTDFLVKCTNINKFYRKQHVLKILAV